MDAAAHGKIWILFCAFLSKDRVYRMRYIVKWTHNFHILRMEKQFSIPSFYFYIVWEGEIVQKFPLNQILMIFFKRVAQFSLVVICSVV